MLCPELLSQHRIMIFCHYSSMWNASSVVSSNATLYLMLSGKMSGFRTSRVSEVWAEENRRLADK